MGFSSSVGREAHRTTSRGRVLSEHRSRCAWLKAVRRGVGENLGLIALVLFEIAPFAWLISIALRPVGETYVIPQPILPSHLTLENFASAMEYVPRLVLYYRNSFIITGLTVFLVLVCASMAGYVFARLKFRARNLLFWMLTVTMFIPASIVLPALYNHLSSLGLNDTMAGLILSYTGWYLGFGTFIMRGVFGTIPAELEEAARIDGASTYQIFSRIMLPLSRSGLIVVAIFTFVPVWGEYLWAFTLTQSHAAMPMSVAIKFFDPSPASGKYTFNLAAAASLMMFIPAIVVYLGLQRWFTKGLMEGALKF